MFYHYILPVLVLRNIMVYSLILDYSLLATPPICSTVEYGILSFTIGNGSSGISLPHKSHPSTFCLANSSILGISPISSTILVLIMSGFFECPSLGSMITLDTKFDLISGLPFIANKQTSLFDFV